MKKNSLLNKRTGFSLLEISFTIGILGIGIVGLMSSFDYFTKSQKKSQSTNMALSIESSILTDLPNQSNYNDHKKQYQLQMAKGESVNLDIIINIYNPISGSLSSQLSVHVGDASTSYPSYVDINGVTCAGFDRKSCVYKISIATDYSKPSDPHFSYMIETDPNFAVMHPIQGKVEAPTSAGGQSSNSDCVAQGGLAAYGISNGNIICLNSSYDSKLLYKSQLNPALETYEYKNIFPTGIFVNSYNPATGELLPGYSGKPEINLTFSKGNGSYCCPPDYSLQKVSIADIILSSQYGTLVPPSNNVCVYAPQSDEIFPTIVSGTSIIGKPCPPGYDPSLSTCNADVPGCSIWSSLGRSVSCTLNPLPLCLASKVHLKVRCKTVMPSQIKPKYVAPNSSGQACPASTFTCPVLPGLYGEKICT